MSNNLFRFIDRSFTDAIVLLSGWATDGRIFSQLELKYNYLILGKADPFNFSKALLDYLDANSIEKVSLFGHSMGGFMAKEFALSYPERVDQVFLVSVRRKYPNQQLKEVEEQLKKNKRGFLYKFYLDCFSEDDKEGRGWFKKNLLRDYVDSMSLEDLLRGLDYLSKVEITAAELAGVKNLKIFHGSEDKIASVNEIKDLAAARLNIINGVGHMPFLMASGSCLLTTPPSSLTLRAAGASVSSHPLVTTAIDKKAVINNFSKCASSYEEYADIQNLLADELFLEISRDGVVGDVLDVGCGTGRLLDKINKAFPHIKTIGLDLSFGMTKIAYAKGVVTLVSEAEELPFGNNVFDLVISNAVYQWVSDLESAFREVDRILKHGGVFSFNCFGHKTLQELRSSFGIKENIFPTSEQIKLSLKKVGFSSIKINTIEQSKDFGSLINLLQWLKSIGANRGFGKPPFLTKNKLNALNTNRCATFEVIKVRARKN